MINYRVVELVPTGPNTAGGLDYDAKGTLTISGVTRTNAMPVTISKAGGKIKVLGSTSLKMTDYGVKPPAPELGLGLIKTGDEVKLTFEWVTEVAQ
jgi:polyisoprenoid-binding protein YceI